MGLLLGESKLDWGNWVRGVAAAFIGGGSNAVVAGVALNLTDPAHFNAANPDFYKIVGTLFASSGLISAFMFLKQNPIPAVRTITTTVERKEKQLDPPAVITTIVEEKKIAPMDGGR